MKYTILALYVLSTTCLATVQTQPTLEFSGVGQLRVKADYVKLVLAVGSQCYDTPLEAQKATDQVVEKIDKYLRTLREPNDQYFKILIDGGFTSAFSRWYQNKEVCRNTFQKNTHITLHLKAVKDFSKLFTQIQSEVLQNYHRETAWGTDNKAQTFVSLGTPEPRITRLNRIKKEQEALNLALLDAQANAKAAIKSCPSKPSKIINIKEAKSHNFAHNNRFYLQARALPAAQGGGAPEEAPVRFDDLIISQELIVTFELEGPLCPQS